MKRGFDFLVALFGLLLSIPVLVVLVVLIRLDSPGPGIFSQYRVGRHEKLFKCYKLRTMKQETADAPSHEIGAASVTRYGRFLRKVKLDELPQLWNIVKGDMSFVGPRPCLPKQTELIEERRKRGLYQIRPGITGVSQVNGVDMSDARRLAELDAAYLDNMSLSKDIGLIVATVFGAGRGDRTRM